MKKKNNINFTTRLAVAKKISIKALDFEKLPRKFSGSNYMGNAFLNITRSSSNRGPKDNLTSSLTKNKGKILFAKPLTSRSRNENAIKLNVIPKTTATIINITQGQKMHNSHQSNNNTNKPQKPLNKLFTHSLYVSYNNSSSTYKTFNSNAPANFSGNQKSNTKVDFVIDIFSFKGFLLFILLLLIFEIFFILSIVLEVILALSLLFAN